MVTVAGGGAATITDLDPAAETVNLVISPAPAAGAVTLADNGANVEVRVSGTVVAILQGTNSAAVTAGNAVLVNETAI